MKVNYISHRGNDDDLCENKIKCLLDTLSKDYVDGIEIDVRMTKDKKFILNHNLLIINNFKVYNIDTSNYKDLNIDSLNNLLNKINNNKIIMIDMKCLNNYKKYANNLIKLLKKYKYLNISLASFNYDLIKYIKIKYPSYKCGLIIGYQININKEYKMFDFISIHSSLINKYNFPHYIWSRNITIDNKCIGVIANKKE